MAVHGVKGCERLYMVHGNVEETMQRGGYVLMITGRSTRKCSERQLKGSEKQ